MDDKLRDFIAQCYKDDAVIKEIGREKDAELKSIFDQADIDFYNLSPADRVNETMKKIELIMDGYGLDDETYLKAKSQYPDMIAEINKMFDRIDIEYNIRILDLYSKEGWIRYEDQVIKPWMEGWIKIIQAVKK